jgi:very-long-chain (3R)-3-hydroxyacyl-CoA dehydratase
MKCRILFYGLGKFIEFINGRYTTFYVLYPIGVAGELLTMKAAWNEAYTWNPMYAYLIIAVALVYIPGKTLMNEINIGFPSLYMHMIRQRRKGLGTSKQKKKE